MATVRTLARLERLEFADLLDRMTPEQWASPSLCAGWTVRDVAAHTVAYLDQSRIALAANMIRFAGDVDRLNADGVDRHSRIGRSELADRMRRGSEPAGAGALYGAGSRSSSVWSTSRTSDVHWGCIAISTRAGSGSAWTTHASARGRRPAADTRVRLVATDVDWTAGNGPEVVGPGEALLFAMTGRAAAVAGELRGEGVALLR